MMRWGPQILGAGFRFSTPFLQKSSHLELGVRGYGHLDKGRVRVAEYGKLGAWLGLQNAKNASCSKRDWL